MFHEIVSTWSCRVSLRRFSALSCSRLLISRSWKDNPQPPEKKKTEKTKEKLEMRKIEER